MLIKGKAKIINKAQDYYRIKEGVVIVARNTHPDITVIMDKVLAIVVEFDNKLCHAAIIAREYKKPILMGIKNIRKKIKDGDWVSVDTVRKTVCKI